MPRQARKESETKTYHIMLRGINKQQIFEDKQDYERFISILSDCKEICEYKVIAYCLMGNHIHLLLRLTKEDCSLVMKRICTRFVYWYNLKYGRTGHLFQDRYKSEPVEDDDYLLTVTAYIHQNPIKAGITETLKYDYSSYKAYLKDRYTGLVDCDIIYSFIKQAEFLEWQNESVKEKVLDIKDDSRPRLTDEKVMEIMMNELKCDNITEFQKTPTAKRDIYIRQISEAGASIRQISRLTGVSIAVVRRIIVK